MVDCEGHRPIYENGMGDWGRGGGWIEKERDSIGRKYIGRKRQRKRHGGGGRERTHRQQIHREIEWRSDREIIGSKQIGRKRQGKRQGRERKIERETEARERTQNSELYYSRIKILGSCLFLQSVPANLHANRLHIKQW